MKEADGGNMEEKLEEKYKGLKLAEKGARISIIAYLILAAIKLGFGYFAGSEALTADGLNNTTDIVSSLAVVIGLRIARKPADDNHHYGHFRAETVASLIASCIMIGVGIDVFYQAIRSILIEEEMQAPDMISAFVGLFCAAMIYFVYRYNKKIALKIHSSGLMAAAKDNLSDAWVSIGTSIGILSSQFGLPWLDPLAAVLVGILIIKTGWEIFHEASYNLTDGFSREQLDIMAKSVQNVLGVVDVEDIKARAHGNNILVDVVVKVNPGLSIIEAHNITEEIEEKLKKDLAVTDVVIHVEPDDE